MGGGDARCRCWYMDIDGGERGGSKPLVVARGQFHLVARVDGKENCRHSSKVLPAFTCSICHSYNKCYMPFAG